MALTESRLADLRARARLRDHLFAASEVRELLDHLDAQAAELATLRGAEESVAYWRKAFERLRDSDAREVRDRLDRVSARALGLTS